MGSSTRKNNLTLKCKGEGFTNMDNHGYDGREAKPKNNNTYTDPSMTNGSLQQGWSNGGPGYSPPGYSEATPVPLSKENEVELQDRKANNPEKNKKKISTQISQAKKKKKKIQHKKANKKKKKKKKKK